MDVLPYFQCSDSVSYVQIFFTFDGNKMCNAFATIIPDITTGTRDASPGFPVVEVAGKGDCQAKDKGFCSLH